jgi:hypothetical protein
MAMNEAGLRWLWVQSGGAVRLQLLAGARADCDCARRARIQKHHQPI